MNQLQQQLIEFLQEDLAIPSTSVRMALRQQKHDVSQLPIILWNYGLISIQQLEQIFDWLETV